MQSTVSLFDMDQYRSNNDSGVLLNSKTGKKLAQGSLNSSNGTTLNEYAEYSFLFFARVNTPLVQCDVMQYLLWGYNRL